MGSIPLYNPSPPRMGRRVMSIKHTHNRGAPPPRWARDTSDMLDPPPGWARKQHKKLQTTQNINNKENIIKDNCNKPTSNISFQKLQKGKHKMKWEKFNQKLRDKNKLQKWELVVKKI